MRLLHIDAGRQMRGGQWQVLYLLEGLAGAGHEALLLAPRSSPLYELARSKGRDVMPLRISMLPRLSGAMDVVHAHDARSHTLGALMRPRLLLVARRVAFPVQRNPFSDWKYAQPRHYLAVSQFVKQRLTAGGVDARKISVVYDGVPLGALSGGEGPIVAPASEDPMKGAALVRKAATLGGLDVQFSSRLSEDLQQASAFVYITHQEGLGSAVLLAMACGVPVVASRVGGLVEIIEHEKTGLLTDNTPKAIASAVARLRQDRALAARLAAAARRRVQERFSVEVMVRSTLRVYEEVMS